MILECNDAILQEVLSSFSFNIFHNLVMQLLWSVMIQSSFKTKKLFQQFIRHYCITKMRHSLGCNAIFSNLRHEDFSPNQNGKFVGRNVLLVLTFSFFEPRRGSRGLPSAFSDCLMYFFHFRFSGVATYKPSLGPFSWSKEKKTLNAHISKSLLAPKWRFSKTLQKGLDVRP